MSQPLDKTSLQEPEVGAGVSASWSPSSLLRVSRGERPVVLCCHVTISGADLCDGVSRDVMAGKGLEMQKGVLVSCDHSSHYGCHPATFCGRGQRSPDDKDQRESTADIHSLFGMEPGYM